MRKILFVCTGLILITTISIYLFIPQVIVVSEAEQVESSERIISQYLSEPDSRARWWKKTSDTSYQFTSNGFRYHFTKAGYNSISVLISSKNFKHDTKITWTPYANNILEIRWRTSQNASIYPVKRLQQYFEARKIKSDMASILERLLSFTTKTQNVYHLNIERQLVRDTLLATSSFRSIKHPDNRQIYRVIDSVKKYISKQNISPVNAPMLNVTTDADGSYTTTIALPINKPITPNQHVLINRMIAGNILVAEVKGGPGKITNAFNQIKVYMGDFKLSSPAIPFESLVTDRRAEPDTSKWTTKIYYPIY